jgi:hypothetical protein
MGDVVHQGTINGFINLEVEAINGNIDFSLSSIGNVIELNSVTMTAQSINTGYIGAVNNISLTSSTGSIVFDRLISNGVVDLISGQNITTINNSINDDVVATTLNTVTAAGYSSTLTTAISNFSALNTGAGIIAISNTGSINLNGIDNNNGVVYVSATGNISQNGDILISNGSNDLTLMSGSGITMVEPVTTVINQGDITYSAYDDITISELTINAGDGLISVISQTGNIVTTNTAVSINEPHINAQNAGFIAPNGSLGVGSNPFVFNVPGKLTIFTQYSVPPLFYVTPAEFDDSSTHTNPADISSILGGDQRTQFAELSTVDPAIFSEVRNFEEEETAILLPDDQLYN